MLLKIVLHLLLRAKRLQKVFNMGHDCVVTHSGGSKKIQVETVEVNTREVGVESPERGWNGHVSSLMSPRRRLGMVGILRRSLYP